MVPPPLRVLVVDDEPSVCLTIAERLRDDGHDVTTAGDGAGALEGFGLGVDAVVLDQRLPDSQGLDVLRRMHRLDPSVPVILLTGYSDVDQAVRAMKEGAYHYGRKPFDLDQLAEMVGLALENGRLRRRIRALEGRSDGPTLIGESAAMREVRSVVEKIAASPSTTVLVTGESGTGKDVVARLLHAKSARADAPFTNVTCSALPDALLESELFGHEKGAFTDAKVRKQGLFELTQGGTLFLDEIAEMAPALQAKLLRVLEEKAYRRVGGSADLRADVRIVAATNRELSDEIEAGRFREDLYYRLAVLEVRLPPLRERGGDLRLLTEHLIGHFGAEFHKPIERVEAAVWSHLERHGWPGNVRELRNAVERAVLLSEDRILRVGDFAMIGSEARERPRFELPPEGVDLAEVETELLTQALERTQGNRTQAGRLLALNRDQVRYRITKLGLGDRFGTP